MRFRYLSRSFYAAAPSMARLRFCFPSAGRSFLPPSSSLLAISLLGCYSRRFLRAPACVLSFVLSFTRARARARAIKPLHRCLRFPAAPQHQENAPGPSCTDFSEVQSTIAVCRLRARIPSRGRRRQERRTTGGVHFSSRGKSKNRTSKYLSSSHIFCTDATACSQDGEGRDKRLMFLLLMTYFVELRADAPSAEGASDAPIQSPAKVVWRTSVKREEIARGIMLLL